MSTKILLFGLVMLMSIGFVSASVLDVCLSGCSYSTIQSAIDNSSIGDTVSIASGTYVESVVVNQSVSIVGNGSMSIVQPLVDANGFNVSVDGVVVQDLRIVLSTSGVDAQAIAVSNSSNVVLANLIIDTSGDKGIGVWVGGSARGNSMNLSVSNNVITIVGESTGLYVEMGAIANSGWIISDNNITALNGNPLELYDLSDSIVDGNILTTSVSGGSNTIWSAELSDLSNIVFSNNVVVGSLASQLVIGSDISGQAPDNSVSGVIISGNSFSDWDSRALRIGYVTGAGTTTGVVVENNSFLDTGVFIRNMDLTQVDAVSNWFGTTNIVTITSGIVGNVSFTPYFDSFSLTTLSDCPTELWVLHSSVCNGVNLSVWYTDANLCGTNNTLPSDNGSVLDCLSSGRGASGGIGGSQEVVVSPPILVSDTVVSSVVSDSTVGESNVFVKFITSIKNWFVGLFK